MDWNAHKIIIAVMEKNVKNGHVIGNGACALFEFAKNRTYWNRPRACGGCALKMNELRLCCFLCHPLPPVAVGAAREIGRYGGIKLMLALCCDLTLPVEAVQQMIWTLSQLSVVGMSPSFRGSLSRILSVVSLNVVL